MTSRRRKTEHGTVTAELALLFPVLLATIVAGVWATGLVVANIRCVDSARDVARAVARGESPETATSIGHRTAPKDATVDITTDGEGVVRVVVTTERHLNWPLFAALPPITLQAQATLQAEPGQDSPP